MFVFHAFIILFVSESIISIHSCSSDEDCVIRNSCTQCNISTMQCIPTSEFSSNCRTHGSPSVLVLNVYSLDSLEPSSKELVMLSESIFGYGSNLNMKSQFADCSFNLFTPTPLQEIEIESLKGSSIIPLDIPGVKALSLANTTVEGAQSGAIVNEILAQAASEIKNLHDIDLLMLCLPFGSLIGSSSNWKAYAFVDDQISVYNGDNCKFPSVNMHEIGHNIGLSHSNDLLSNYGDEAGLMGLSYNATEYPYKCFNGPKSWQLGWYSNGHLVITPSYYYSINIKGFVDYPGSITIVKLIEVGDGFDYFLTFNRKYKQNSNTNLDTADKLLVHRRPAGSLYEDSTLLAALGQYQRYDIPNTLTFTDASSGGSSLSVYTTLCPHSTHLYCSVSVNSEIKRCSTASNCDDKNSCTEDSCEDNVQYEGTVCTYIRRDCSSCGALVSVQYTTNIFPDSIQWHIADIYTNEIVKYSNQTLAPNATYEDTDCLQYGKYIFSVSYATNYTEDTGEFEYALFVGDVLMDNDTISEESYVESFFIICASDLDCEDYNGCTTNVCNATTNLCENLLVETDAECRNCSWFFLNITTDNYPEETTWSLNDGESKVLFGNPWSFDFSVAYGHRTSTENGRRSKPTRAGRRSKPTKAGRRSKPTRAGMHRSLKSSRDGEFEKVSNEITVLNEVEDEILQYLCLESNIKYSFTIEDTFGDGICCSEGEGSYAIGVYDNTIKQGGNFSHFQSISFSFSECALSSECDDGDLCTNDVCNADISTCIYYQKSCEECGLYVSVIVHTDTAPDENRWLILKQNTEIASSEAYMVSNQIYEFKQCFQYGFYNFIMSDAGGVGFSNCNVEYCGYTLDIGSTILTSVDQNLRFSTRVTPFGICTDDSHCDNGDFCTIGVCNTDEKVCEFTQRPCSDCGKSHLSITVRTDASLHPPYWFVSVRETNEILFSGGNHTSLLEYSYQKYDYCISEGAYQFLIKSEWFYSETKGSYCSEGYICGYSIEVDNVTIVEELGVYVSYKSHNFDVPIPSCFSNEDCDDDDLCTNDVCDLLSNRCTNQQISCNECGTIFSYNIFTDQQINYNMGVWDNSWSLTKNGSELLSETSMELSYKSYNTQICLHYGSYSFTIRDSSENGLEVCPISFWCGFSVKLENETILESSGNFFIEKINFGICTNDSHCINTDSCLIGNCNETTSRCFNYTQMPCSFCNKDSVEVTILTDEKGYETTWELNDIDTLNVVSGGPYSRNFNAYNRSYCLSKGEYEFTVFDTGNDGMLSCESGACGFIVKRNEEIVLDEIGNFSSTKTFRIISRTNYPSEVPSPEPSLAPSTAFSHSPSIFTRLPSFSPSAIPIQHPSNASSKSSSNTPSFAYSSQPTAEISFPPSYFPSKFPSTTLSHQPSAADSNQPSREHITLTTNIPSILPSSFPSGFSSKTTSTNPSNSLLPSFLPSISSIPTSLMSSTMDSWFIEFYKGINSDNSSKILDGFALFYNISKEKLETQILSRVFDFSCSVESQNKAVSILDKAIIRKEETDLDELVVSLKFNSSQIVHSPLWKATSNTSGTLEFCVITELLLEDNKTSVSFSKTKVTSNIKFEAMVSSFEMGNVRVEEKKLLHMNENAPFDVTACLCDESSTVSYSCSLEKTLKQNTILNICVSPPAGLMVHQFQNIILYQENIAKLVAVHKTIPDQLTKIYPELGIVTTRLTSNFFNGENPPPITLKGDVLLEFKNTRELSSRSRNLFSNKEEKNIASFELQIYLESSRANKKQNILKIFGLLSLATLIVFRFHFLKKTPRQYSLLKTQNMM